MSSFVLRIFIAAVSVSLVAGLRKAAVAPKIGICTMLKDEVPYLFEWIEYYQQQGVNHFRLYDDGSSDHMDKLPDVWKPSRGAHVSVHSIPGQSGWGYPGQMESLDDCIADFVDQGLDWVGFVDTDEFVAFTDESPQRTLQSFLGARQAHIQQVRFRELRFASEQVDHDPHYSIRNSPQGWTACFDGDEQPLLVTETEVRRQPSADIPEENHAAVLAAHPECDKTVNTIFGPWKACYDGPGKSFLRAGACTAEEYQDPHFCPKLNEVQEWVNLHHGRLHHHLVRSVEQQRARPWMRDNGGGFMNATEDRSALRTVPAGALKKALPTARCDPDSR